jgi:hypothetical protein|tara:strand:+ start:357 stop:731 length:375 start_codon:yes stop_codon:yes gene_type:complete
MVSDVLESLFILVLQEEVKEEIRCKNGSDKVIDLFHRKRDLHVKGNKEYSGHAGVSDDHQVERIKYSLPLGVLRDDEVLRLQVVPERSFDDLLLDLHIFVLFHAVVLVGVLESNVILEEEPRLL